MSCPIDCRPVGGPFSIAALLTFCIARVEWHAEPIHPTTPQAMPLTLGPYHFYKASPSHVYTKRRCHVIVYLRYQAHLLNDWLRCALKKDVGAILYALDKQCTVVLLRIFPVTSTRGRPRIGPLSSALISRTVICSMSSSDEVRSVPAVNRYCLSS